MYSNISNCRMLLHMCWVDTVCALITWQQFSAENDVIATTLKVRHQTANPTPSMDAYLLEEQSCQIPSRSSLK